jgi:hypothetical protein
LVYLYNIGYVLLFPPIPERYPYVDHWQEAWDFVKATLPLEDKPFWSEGGIEAYRVAQPAGADAFHLDLGAPGTFPYRGEGWDSAAEDIIYDTTAIWATEGSSRLFIPLRTIDPTAGYQVTVRLHPYAYPGAPQQRVTLTVNGTSLATQPVAPDWQELSWEVPGSLLLNGLNRLELAWDYHAVPRTVLAGNRAIGTTGVQLPVDAELKAFADGGYIALYDEEGAQSDGSAGRRGVNVTVMDPATGDILDKKGFDTTANPYESDALADYLATIPAGQIILVATYGDAWSHLTAEAVAELQKFGLDVTLETIQGHYLAAAGVQGAAAGSGAWVLHESEAFLKISLERDRRALAAAVDWVEVERAK